MAEQSRWMYTFSLYANSIRKRTQMAYQQAMQEAQASQASELAQRQLLLEMLKLDNQQLINIRKNIASAQKEIRTLSKGKSKSNLEMQLANAINAQAAVGARSTTTTDKIQELLDEQYTLDPSLQTAIDTYNTSIKLPVGTNYSKDQLNRKLGFADESGQDAKNAQKLRQAFANVNPNQKALGLNLLQQNMYRKLQGEDSSVDGNLVSINQIFGEALSIPKIKNSVMHKSIDANLASRLRFKKQEQLKREYKVTATEDLYLTSQSQVKRIQEQIKNQSNQTISPESRRAITKLKSNINQFSTEKDQLIKRMGLIRNSILSPGKSSKPTNIRAGEILIEQQAANRMGSAINNMTNEDIEAIQLMERAKSFKGNKSTNTFIDAYIKGLKKNSDKDPSLQTFFANVNEQVTDAGQKERLKLGILKRLMDSQNTDPKSKVQKAFKKETSANEDRILEQPGPLNISKSVPAASTSFKPEFNKTYYNLNDPRQWGYQFIDENNVTFIKKDGTPVGKFSKNTPQYEEAMKIYKQSQEK